MKKRLFVHPTRCIGCRSCELACAFAHAPQPNRPAGARVRTFTFSETENVPVLCLQCDNAACVAVCPTGALVRDAATGAITVLSDRCVQCRMCTVACPFGNIHFDEAAAAIAKCDLCGGDPACAKFCPTAALEFAVRPTRTPPPKPSVTRPMVPRAI